MENSDICDTWAQHYPRHHDNRESAQICRRLCDLVRARVRQDIQPGSPDEKLARALAAAGIPAKEFEECEARYSL